MQILLVDDSPAQCLMLAAMLRAAGYHDLVQVHSARAAYAVLAQAAGPRPCPIDLIFMDLRMPETDGITACGVIKAMDGVQDVPIIMLTSSVDSADLTQAFAAGAIDYIFKPPSKMELLARMRSALRLKFEMDQRTAQTHELHALTEQLNQEQHRSDRLLLDLHAERERSERLLLTILPAPIAARLKDGEQVIADSYDDVTVLFIDLVDFTVLASAMAPSRLVTLLNTVLASAMAPSRLVTLLNAVFSSFDAMVEAHGLEKIKTIGDAYMVVGGLLHETPQPVQAMAALALAMQTTLQAGFLGWPPLQARIGIHCGPVTAGIIGTNKLMYDLWGDTVNIASRMETHGLPGQIHISEAIYARLSGSYRCIPRGTLEIKGKGPMPTYLLMGEHAGG